MRFEPNYQNIVDAAYNREAQRIPLYEHGFDSGIAEQIIGEPVVSLLPKIEGLGGIASTPAIRFHPARNRINWIAMCEAVREWRGENFQS